MSEQLDVLRGMLAELEAHGELPDSRTDIDTASLVTRFPELEAVTVTEVEVALAARLYTPASAVRTSLVWVHGGAFVAGTLDMPESHWVALTLASRGVRVLAVDYRKALGGVRYPAPSDDVLAAWAWACENFGGRIHLGGASAGANLAAGATKRLRDAGEPLPASLVLVYPLVHAQLPAPSAEIAAATSLLPDAARFSPEAVEFINAQYAGNLSNEYAFPGLGDVSGYPPTYILNAECDDLRCSGELFAERLASAGVTVRCEFEPGASHGHLDTPDVPAAQLSLDRLTDWLTSH